MKRTINIPKVHYHKLDRNSNGRTMTDLELYKDNLNATLNAFKDIGQEELLVSLINSNDKDGDYFSVGIICWPDSDPDNGSVIRLNDELELVVRRKKST